jgi:hypothetical protein
MKRFRPLKHWDHGFESRSMHESLSAFILFVLFCVDWGLETGWSPVQGILLSIFFSMSLPAQSRPRPLVQFRNHFSQTVGLLGRVISSSQGRYLSTGQHKHRINTYTHQTSIPWVGFEPTIPASERAKTIHALDHSVTVTGKKVKLYLCLIN